MNVVIIIPARFQSTRFPGKPLFGLRGANGAEKPLIQRTCEAARNVAGVSGIFIATDDAGIADACRDFRADVIMTSRECRNGTERCAEAVRSVLDPHLIINFQGDALLTPPHFVEALIDKMRCDPAVLVATPAIRLRTDELRALQAEEAAGRVGGTSVVMGTDGRALYFSKRLLPYVPESALQEALSPVRQHVGVYAYRPEALHRYVQAPVSDLEQLEGLEQLRFLDMGIPVAIVEVPRPDYSLRELNNPEDVPEIESALVEAGVE
jgi:3-deoxy-manno-octulosonate cytidylyltransferase (CMP-KDO synthetase)